MSEPILLMITGFRGTGKTTLCLHLAAAAQKAGWKVSGLASPPVYDGQVRSAIEVQNLASGERKTLAVRRSEVQGDATGIHTRNWQFDPQVLAWGNQVLKASVPTDLLVVDELGTLELEHGQGWKAGIDAVESRQYAVALVVIRSELLAQALVRWPDADIVEIDTPEDSSRKAETLTRQLF